MIIFFHDMPELSPSEGKMEEKSFDPIIESLCLRKISGIATGQTLQLARKKCMAKGCFDLQNNDFGEKLSLFRHYFIRNGCGCC